MPHICTDHAHDHASDNKLHQALPHFFFYNELHVSESHTSPPEPVGGAAVHTETTNGIINL